MKFKVSKNDGDDIGVAKVSLSSGIISLDEFKEWVLYVIRNAESVESLPPFFYMLTDIKKRLILHCVVRNWWALPPTGILSMKR